MAKIRSDFMIPNGTESDGTTHYDEGRFRTDADLVELYQYQKPDSEEEITSSDNAQGAIAKLDKKSEILNESKVSKNQIGVFVSTAPSYYQRQQIFSTNKTTITIYPTWVNIGDSGYILSENKSINIASSGSWDTASYATAANRAGKDFYIYACVPSDGTEPDFILSANSTVPTGYTATNSRKIGGFHCLAVAVGTISGNTLTGYGVGDILPATPWDLKHRAVSENEGMSYISGCGIWMDIYLPSWNGSKLVSVYGGTVADGASSKKFHGEAFAEAFGKIGKRLVRRDEFICAMKGSNEQTNIKNSADPNTTGGHVDTSNRRMISNYGIEDGCGAYWQWAEDQYEAMSVSWTNPNRYMNSYSWQQASVYESSVDSQGFGSAYGLLRRAILGGYWDAGAYCGSRCVNCSHFSSRVYANVSARGVSEPRCGA